MINLRFFTFIILSLYLAAPTLQAQLSPGDLTQAHSRLEGLSNCTKCHTLGKQVENAKCLSCHNEMQKLISENHGYHSSADVKNKKCETCHSEHHGRGFQIIHFDKKKLNHEKTGFQLTGKHAQIDCEKCHQSKNIQQKISKKQGFSFLGLQTACASCHEDYHAGSLEKNCATCHSTDAFKPVKQFDHGKTKFPLTGNHQKLACEKCHVKTTQQGKTFQKFASQPFGNCTPCHKDAHDGKLGADCKKCHSTASFHKVSSGSFDHSKTSFPLIGQHAKVACSKCHTTGSSLRLKYQFCTDCHKDEHKGRFVDADKKPMNCSSCHTVEGFKPSGFTLERHNRSRFPLTGSHLSIPCENCHLQEKTWIFTKESGKCTDCHKNVHGNELGAKFLGDNDCKKCHTDNSWKEISFDHAATGFMLTGKHAKATCMQCHLDKKDPKNYLFSSLNNDCLQCHKDIHAGQFTENKTADCIRCHHFENWQPVKFDHNLTKFMLKGAHENVPCLRCHKKVNNGNEFYALYRLKEFKCANCHS